MTTETRHDHDENSEFDKSQLRPCLYGEVRRPLGSDGHASVYLPMPRWVMQFRCKLGIQALELAQSQVPKVDVEAKLQDGQLCRDDLSLHELYRQTKSFIKVLNTKRLTKLSLDQYVGTAKALVDDLEARRKELRDHIRPYATELLERLKTASRQTLLNCAREGTVADAREAVARIRESIAQAEHELSVNPVTYDNLQVVRAQATKLESFPKGFLARWIAWLFVRASLNWFVRGDKKKIAAISGEIAKVDERLLNEALARAKREIWAKLSESLEGYLEEASRQPNILQMLRAKLEAGVPPIERSPNKLLVAENIGDPIDRNGTTAEAILAECAEQAGCTPAQFAQLLSNEQTAIKIDGQITIPHAYAHHREPGRVIDEIALRLGQFLGLDQQHVNPEPRTAYDYIGRVTLTHPQLERAVRDRLLQAIDLSRPYIEVPRIASRREQVSGRFTSPGPEPFLLAWPGDAAMIRSWMPGTRFRNGPAEKGYHLSSPFLVMIFQSYLGVAGHAQRSFAQCLHTARRIRAEGHDQGITTEAGQRQFELRLLQQRTDDESEVRRLLEVLQDLDEVCPVASDEPGLVLRNFAPALNCLFRRRTIYGSSQPAAYFQSHLRQHGDFGQIISETCNISTHELDRLANARDPEKLAKRLCEAKGLIETEPGLYRWARPVRKASRLPRGMVVERFDELTGLPEPQFIKAMVSDDLLYNACFWRADDAVAEGRLDVSDLPPFAQWCSAQLERGEWMR